jgi:transposase
MFLPSYSPDFNPIEQYWSFLKDKLKKLALYCLDFFKNLNEVLRMKYVKVGG